MEENVAESGIGSIIGGLLFLVALFTCIVILSFKYPTQIEKGQIISNPLLIR